MPIDKAKINQLLTEIDDRTAAIRAELQQNSVATSDGLTAALQGGGTIELVEGHAFLGDFKVSKPTEVLGVSNPVSGINGPAWDIGLGVQGASLVDMVLDAKRSEIVVLVGRNTTAQTPENTPRDITLDNLVVESHRGKRAIEFSGAGRITGCRLVDCYDPEGIENQAIWIAVNSPGPVDVISCRLEGGSQGLMIGGDDQKIPGQHTTGVRIVDTVVTKPIAWKAAGIPKVKTLLEFKDGIDVTVENCELFNCWQSAQDGYALVITPRRKGIVRNLLLKDLEVHDVGGIANITGFDDPYPELPRTQVTFLGGTYKTNRSVYGGRGIFALITNGPEAVRIINVHCEHTGNSFIQCGDGDPIELLEITGSTWNYGSYGIFINGQVDGNNDAGLIKNLIIENNTISGAKAAFKARYPNNTYV